MHQQPKSSQQQRLNRQRENGFFSNKNVWCKSNAKKSQNICGKKKSAINLKKKALYLNNSF